MFNWFNLSDVALIRAANHIAEAEATADELPITSKLHMLAAQRYQAISRYCLIRARRMFAL